MKKDVIIALLSGLTASTVGAGVQYAITLQQIETPKLALEERKLKTENRKLLLDAHKQILALSPATDTDCSATRWNEWSWQIGCNTKSTSQYPVWVNLDKISLSIASDAGRKDYNEGQGFSLFHPKDKKSFLATPGSTGYLEFFIIFDKSKYSKGLNYDDVSVQTTFQYSVVDSARKLIEQTFPEQTDLIGEVSKTPPRVLHTRLHGSTYSSESLIEGAN